jgi:diguanylate cyclase (GGDEF)-like protein
MIARMPAVRGTGWGEEDGRARIAELINRLRAAAIYGDRMLIERLLAELLRLPGVPRRRRAALQLPALAGLLDSLHALAMSDELTGLYNRRGFMQIGARFLEIAARDARAVYLVYADLDNLKQVNDSDGHASGDRLIRQAGSLLRELFPNHGVYEVLGRLGGDEFAALTTQADHATRSTVVMRACRAPHLASMSPLCLSAGVAHFDPQWPLDLGELIKAAERAMYEHKRAARVAPSAFSGCPL